MAFIATLSISDSTSSFTKSGAFNLLECDYGFSQALDETLKPSARPKGGLITMVVESTSDVEFIDWVMSPTMTKSGEIKFSKRDGQGTMRTLSFVDAYCVQYHEKFRSTDSNPMQIFMTISAREISVGTSKHENPWPNA